MCSYILWLRLTSDSSGRINQVFDKLSRFNLVGFGIIGLTAFFRLELITVKMPVPPKDTYKVVPLFNTNIIHGTELASIR